MTEIDLSSLGATRLAWQALAEHVLSAALWASTGHIGLRRAPGGFATPDFDVDGVRRRIAVDGAELVVTDGAGERRAAITTLIAAGAFAGVVPGAPTSVYTPTTPLDLDAPLDIDAKAARRLADWFAIVDDALEQLRAEARADDPAIVQIWPEHFDLATTIGAVNYGGSPGDAVHPTPYLYVGPHEPPAQDGGFWNEPFGASLDGAAVASVYDAQAFFREGRRLSP